MIQVIPVIRDWKNKEIQNSGTMSKAEFERTESSNNITAENMQLDDG